MRLLSRGQKKKLVAALLFLLLALAATWQPQWFERLPDEARRSQPGLYEVEEVSDGDTIIVNMNGRREIIRMIGVDTPETHHPDRPVECYAQIAADYSRRSLTGKKVRLEADPQNSNRDRYDRLLRYVYLPDGALFEESLIAEGYGFSYTQFPFEKADRFESLEAQAEAAKKGLWGSCQVIVEPTGLERTAPAS